MRNSILTIVALVFFTASCKKDNNDSNAITKENLAGSYTLTSAKASFAGSEIDLTTSSSLLPVPLIAACQKDDIITLKTDNTFTLQDAGQTCSPDGSTSGTWSLSGDNVITITGISFVPGSSNISGKIDKYDGKSLQIKDTVTVLAQPVPVSLLFAKQ